MHLLGDDHPDRVAQVRGRGDRLTPMPRRRHRRPAPARSGRRALLRPRARRGGGPCATRPARSRELGKAGDRARPRPARARPGCRRARAHVAVREARLLGRGARRGPGRGARRRPRGGSCGVFAEAALPVVARRAPRAGTRTWSRGVPLSSSAAARRRRPRGDAGDTPSTASARGPAASTPRRRPRSSGSAPEQVAARRERGTAPGRAEPAGLCAGRSPAGAAAPRTRPGSSGSRGASSPDVGWDELVLPAEVVCAAAGARRPRCGSASACSTTWGLGLAVVARSRCHQRCSRATRERGRRCRPRSSPASSGSIST